jgi:drug/metabolite transporter (DMT)-like permease
MEEIILKDNFEEDNNNDNAILSFPNDKGKNPLKASIISDNSNDISNFSNPQKIFYIIILGEIIAILSVSSGEISNKVSENAHRHYGTVLSFIYYLTFGLFWIIFNHGMVRPKLSFFLIILFDTQTNFFKFLALSKGDLYYPYIINSSSILFIPLLTYIFIKKYKYTWKHLLANFLCFFGTLVSFYGVLKGKESILDELRNNYYGFIFSLISAVCFTFTIIFMEIYFNTGRDIYNFFPYLGVFGTIIVSIESIIYFKINNLVIINNFQIDLIHLLYALIFMIISIILGTMVPFYIKRYSASMYNFFMVSQIFWSFIFTLIFQNKNDVSIYFYIGFIIILGSTILFSIFKLKKKIKPENNKNNSLNNLSVLSSSPRTSEY